ncbi:MAG: hypothetical protein M1828_002440 [Chrysothrix sp. TS-e1954]|nr:MAG: hypothetical protein M1828_002440 [Chrysothrix sp. TS-e1954]
MRRISGCYPFGKRLASYTGRNVSEEDDNDDDHPEPPLIVDIGGGNGATLKAIREAKPNLKGRIILSDLPETLGSIPEGFLTSTDRVELELEAKPHDFWQPQPVKGAGLYYLQPVLHDWSDERCVQILSPTADPMAGCEEESRVVATETILLDKVAEGESLNY